MFDAQLECYFNFAAVLAESGQKVGPDLAGENKDREANLPTGHTCRLTGLGRNGYY
jgi:hypothetical protein